MLYSTCFCPIIYSFNELYFTCKSCWTNLSMMLCRYRWFRGYSVSHVPLFHIECRSGRWVCSWSGMICHLSCILYTLVLLTSQWTSVWYYRAVEWCASSKAIWGVTFFEQNLSRKFILAWSFLLFSSWSCLDFVWHVCLPFTNISNSCF